MKNVIKYAVVVLCSLSISVAYAGFGLDSLKSDDKKTAAPAVSMDDTVNQQEALVQRYVASMQSVNSAQLLMAQALGLKEEASGIEDAGKALSSGAVSDADGIKKVSSTSEKANKKIAKKMKKGEDLSDESKILLAKSALPYANGLMETQALSAEFKPFLDSAGSLLKSASMTEKLKVKDKLSTGMFVAKETPGLLSDLVTTSGLLLSYAKDQNVELPKEATSALGDL